MNELPYQEEEENYIPDSIMNIMNMVQVGGQSGLTPQEILSDDEFAEYQAHQAFLQPELSNHFDNLATILPSHFLTGLAQDIVQWTHFDELSRKPWQDREAEGIKLLGVTNEPLFQPAFDGASQISHPLLAEAVKEFHSRAIAELFPPEGPVKTAVLGEITPELEQQAERVQDYMNYQYTEDMPGAFKIEDKLLFRLPLSGSMFKKFYYDPLLKKVVCGLIEPADFIVPYSAIDLESAGRYTHRYRKTHNWILRNIKAGYFVDANFQKAGLDTHIDRPDLLNVIDDAEGKEVVQPDDTNMHTILESVVYLDVPGFEDLDEFGEPTGIELPYKVWVDRDNLTVARIERAWLPDDPDCNKMVSVVHKEFEPGFGFYGFGLLHLIGGLGKAASGFLNALLDSAAFYNMQGGYRSRHARIRGGDLGPLSPGEWREVDCSPEELRNAFFHVPYKEPSQVLFNILGLLDEKSKGFVGGDVMTGEANPNAPVGTTLALIEQGQKKFSAIHRRLHVANREEFKILAQLNSFYIPMQGYPYAVPGGMRDIFPFDFDERVDILPVSDPAITSGSQRIIQGQAVLDLQEKHPTVVNEKEAVRSMLIAMRVPEVDKLVQEGPSEGELLQQQLQKLEIQIKQAELDKLQAEKEQLDAVKTEHNVKALFAAIQAAQLVVMNGAIVPVADEIFASSGGVDFNGAPLIAQGAQMLLAQSAQNAPIDAQIAQPGAQNAQQFAQPSANESANGAQPSATQAPTAPDQGAPVAQPSAPPAPTSPDAGYNAGIETMRNEGLTV